MNKPLMEQNPLRLLITIVDRGRGEKVANVYQECHILANLVMLGIGTAKTDLPSIFGLSDPEKDVVLSIVPSKLIDDIFQRLNDKLHFAKPGKGIAFSIPLSGISSAAYRYLTNELPPAAEKEEHPMGEKSPYDLIALLCEKGQTDIVMEAAKSAGATGGTIVRARALDPTEGEKFFKITLQPEKEIILILVTHENKHDIMQKTCSELQRVTGTSAAAISLPVDSILGLSMPQ